MSKKSTVGNMLIVGVLIMALVWLVSVTFWGLVALYHRIFTKK